MQLTVRSGQLFSAQTCTSLSQNSCYKIKECVLKQVTIYDNSKRNLYNFSLAVGTLFTGTFTFFITVKYNDKEKKMYNESGDRGTHKVFVSDSSYYASMDI